MATPSRSPSRRTKPCSRCCGRTWGSRARSTAASWASAGPVPCCSTARRSSPVWCSASPASGAGSRRSRGWRQAARFIPFRKRSPSWARHSAAIAHRRSFSPPRHSSRRARVRRATRSSRRSRATSAAAPVTSRSTKPSSWRRLACAETTRSRRRRPCMASGKKPSGLRVVGKAHRKVDATAKVTGVTRFADDLFLPRMLFAKLLRSPHPHARILSIDPSRATSVPGVQAVLTGKDLPIPFGILPVSQDEHALALDKVRFVGDPVAAVAATTEEAATQALDLITVEYEVLRAFPDALDALEHPEPAIHDYADAGNIHKLIDLEFGDVERGLAQADVVREDVFFFEGNTHLPMEQHAAVADCSPPPDGKLTLWSATQTPHYVHRALAKVLELPAARIRVIACPNGGGFGGKSDPFSHEIVAAKLAMLTGRPVKITLTREEVFYCHRGRHPTLMWVKTGVTRDGAITGMHFRSLLDGGGYGSYGVASTYYTGALQTVTYQTPRYKFQGARAFTNKPPCGPKRGHGTPQPRFALEVHLDKIAEQLGLDPRSDRRRGAGDRSAGRGRRHRRYRAHARGPGELFESRHAHDRECGDPGSRTGARPDCPTCGSEARGRRRTRRIRGRPRVRCGASRAGTLVCGSRTARRGRRGNGGDRGLVYAAPLPRQVPRLRGRPVARVLLQRLRGGGGCGRGHGRRPRPPDLDRARRGARDQCRDRDGADRRLRVHGAGRGADGGDDVPGQPQRRAQRSQPARVQE